MTKRKRVQTTNGGIAPGPASTKKAKATEVRTTIRADEPVTIQIVTGSYDRVIHGVTATIKTEGDAEFADTFLFTAHTSSIRCVALSPPSAAAPGQTQKVFLASGSTDERINVYNLSAHPPNRKSQDLLSSIAPRPILENPKNRELGTLLHHAATVTTLSFPTRSKLLSSSEDSTIGVTRTRDWSLLSAIKVPKPTALGRPSGDTAPLGGSPSGVNDFAVHPSMKLMISVSKGERSMRLWNLVTGKRAGVLNFGRDILQAVGEGKHSTGEGRKVVWGSTDDGDEFAVGFDRDILVFGMDSVPKCRIMPDLQTKIHQFCYISSNGQPGLNLLVVSTEDGQILFFSTQSGDLSKPADSSDQARAIPTARLVAQLGGKDAGVSGRIKDFAVLQRKENESTGIYIVGGSSDGKLRLWRLGSEELKAGGKEKKPKQVGKILGTYETQNRITCLAAFIMIPRPEGSEESEDESEASSDNEEEKDDDDDDSE